MAVFVLMMFVITGIVPLMSATAEQSGAVDMGMEPFALQPVHKRGEYYLDDSPAEYMIYGTDGGGRFGATLKHLDFNGDGFEDIAVGASYDNGGSVYIFNGSDSLTYPNLQATASEARWELDGSGYFGNDLDVGDVNNDGYDDILVGARSDDYCYLYYGGPYWDTVTSQISDNDANVSWRATRSGYFGYSVAIGDLDGDGYDDLIASTPTYSYGRVYWLFGSDTLSGDYYYDYDGYFDDYNSYYSSSYTYMGSGGMDCGDFNGDGKDDLAVGSPYSYGYTSYVGQVMVMLPKGDFRSFTYGRAYTSRDYADWLYYSADQYYYAIGANPELLDFDDDGYADLTFGNAYSSYTYYNYDKYVYIIKGYSGVSTRSYLVTNSNAYDYRFESGQIDALGQHAWGDYDNDGKMDLAVGGYSEPGVNIVLHDDIIDSDDKEIDAASVSALNIHGPAGSNRFAWYGEHYYYADYQPFETMMFMDRGGIGDALFISDYSNGAGVVYGVESANMVSVSDVEVDDMDDPGEDKIYAGYRDYTLRTDIKNLWDPDGTEIVEWTFRVHDDMATVHYDLNGSVENAVLTEVHDPNDMIQIDPATLIAGPTDPITGLFPISFDFRFTMNLFMEGELDVIATAKIGELRSEYLFEEVAQVKDRVRLRGTLQAYVDGEEVPDHGWVKENSVIEFTGVTVIYNGTEEMEPPIYPPDDVFTATVMNSLGYMGMDEESSGEQFSLLVEVDDRPMEVIFNTYFQGIPEDKVMNPLDPYTINVDTDVPTAPPGVVVHADSFDDINTNVDNDEDLYVTWHPPAEFNSGVQYYEVQCDGKTQKVDVTFAKVNTTEIGEVEVMVRAVDKVGHVGPWASAFILIDEEDLEYTGFFPGEDEWFNTLTPQVGVTVTDIGGRAVRGPSVEYSVSHDGGENWMDWTSAGNALNAKSLEIVVTPTLSEGSNLIRFRASDEAGNILVSDPYAVNVDISGVIYQELLLDDSVDWEGTWLPDPEVDIKLRALDTLSGVDGTTVEYRMTTRSRSDLNSAQWRRVTVDPGNDLIRLGEVELQRGDTNYIQFRARDMVGNAYSYSEVYNIWVNTLPRITISSPEYGSEYTEGDLVTFDAASTSDMDGDALTFTWTDNVTFEGETTTLILGEGEGSLERFQQELTPGTHSVRLTVSDGIHEVTSEPILVVVEERVIPIWYSSEDTDGDGMPNYWEYNYFLGWNDPSNEDNLYNPSSMEGMSRQELFDRLKEDFASDASQVTEENDADGDGHTDFEEYLYGSDPTDALQFPVYEKEGEEVEEEQDLFIPILLAVCLLVVVAIIVAIAVNNGVIKKDIENSRIKEAEEQKQATEATLSAGGQERLDQLLAAARGEVSPGAPFGGAQALPAAQQGEAPQGEQPETTPQPMTAQPMNAQPMEGQNMQAAPMYGTENDQHY